MASERMYTLPVWRLYHSLEPQRVPIISIPSQSSSSKTRSREAEAGDLGIPWVGGALAPQFTVGVLVWMTLSPDAWMGPAPNMAYKHGV